MSQMACLCGSTMKFNLNPSPIEGWILRDQDLENYHEAIGRSIAGYFAAASAGRSHAWLGEFFSAQYPTDGSEESVVADIIAVHAYQFTLSIVECESCGRLWVQRGPSENVYRSFAPDEPGYAGVLRSFPERK